MSAGFSAPDPNRRRVAGRQTRNSRVRRWTIWGVLVPCLLLAGRVDVELGPAGQQRVPAVGTARSENLSAESQSPAERILIAVPPLSRVTDVTIQHDGQTSCAALPYSASVQNGEDSLNTSECRLRDSAGLAFVECRTGARQPWPDEAARLEVGYEPLPRDGRIGREELLEWRTLTDSSARIFCNPADALAWYSPPDTSLSSLFGGDSVPYDFDFAELTGIPLRSQVVIMAHIGGWGNVPLEDAHDILPTIEGIREYLRARGINSVVVPFYRARDGIAGKLLTLSEMFSLHHSDANRLSREINQFLSRHPGQRVVMVGLSNGAAFADEVMLRLTEAVQCRVCAVEMGAPFLNPADAGQSVLRIDNHGGDPVATGDYWILMRVRIEGLFRGVYTSLSGREYRKTGPYVAEHAYSWPNVRPDVVRFLDGWLSR